MIFMDQQVCLKWTKIQRDGEWSPPKNEKFCPDRLTLTLIESQEKFHRPQNISASQDSTNVILSLAEVNVDWF